MKHWKMETYRFEIEVPTKGSKTEAFILKRIICGALKRYFSTFKVRMF